MKNYLLYGHCYWCFHYCIPFIFALYLQTTFFKFITYCLSSSDFIFLTLIVFLSNQDQASALKIACIFRVFGAQSCSMVAQQFDQITYVYEECNTFQDSKLILMISDFKIFPIMLLRQLNCGVTAILRLLQTKNSTFL